MSNIMANTLGSIGFFSTYRPPKPLDLYSLPTSPSLTKTNHERRLSDGKSYNYNGKVIPPAALKLMLKRPLLSHVGTEDDIDKGKLTGLIIVSERTNGLETLHIVLRFKDDRPEIFNFANVYETCEDVRMEDSGVIAGEYIVYVTTKDPSPTRRQPWTAVYRTHLETGETQRLTPQDTSDLSPAVSPDGSKIAVASFQGKDGGWQGEIENLMTNIFVFKMDDPSNRVMIIENGGWPSWGSDNVLYFHRKLDNSDYWAVFRADLVELAPSTNISQLKTVKISQVTPDNIKAFTPSAINENTVAVGTIRLKSNSAESRTEPDQYRHIEIFDSTEQNEPIPITKNNIPKADHYNPFPILHQNDASIGYHRGAANTLMDNPGEVKSEELMILQSPVSNLGLFRVSGVFPTFSKDGSMLAFIDNQFIDIWVADLKVHPPNTRRVYTGDKENGVFSPIWSQDPEKDILYFCKGPSFNAGAEVDIMAIFDASTPNPSDPVIVVKDKYNNAFPCGSPDGTRLVYRSTNGGEAPDFHKNLYIREEAHLKRSLSEIKITRLTNGPWTDTHCDWSPNGKWIVFASTRDKPEDAPPSDNGLDPGYFAVYLVAVDNPTVVIRVMQSATSLAGHVNHPFFSPRGDSIVVVSDLAAVSCDPISLPLFNHSVRPYGDIFKIDIDPDEIEKNKDLETFNRITHSKFENSTCTWTVYSAQLYQKLAPFWGFILNQPHPLRCPFIHSDGSESWQMTGHLLIPDRCC